MEKANRWHRTCFLQRIFTFVVVADKVIADTITAIRSPFLLSTRIISLIWQAVKINMPVSSVPPQVQVHGFE